MAIVTAVAAHEHLLQKLPCRIQARALPRRTELGTSPMQRLENAHEHERRTQYQLTRPADVATALDSVRADVLQHERVAILARGHRHRRYGSPCGRHVGCTREHLPAYGVADGRAQHRASHPINFFTSCRSRCSTGPRFRSSRAPDGVPGHRVVHDSGCSARSPTVAQSGSRSGPAARRRSRPTTSPRVVATVLVYPEPYLGGVLELTVPRSQDMNGVSEEYARALGRPVSYVDVPWYTSAEQTLPIRQSRAVRRAHHRGHGAAASRYRSGIRDRAWAARLAVIDQGGATWSAPAACRRRSVAYSGQLAGVRCSRPLRRRAVADVELNASQCSPAVPQCTRP